MTIVVPVAIPAAGLPLPDPADRATFSARKLEQIRWANAEYSTYSYNLGLAGYSNAQHTQDQATIATTKAADANAASALAAGYAGASLWVSGSSYATPGGRAISTLNGRIYRKYSGAVSGIVDPSLFPTDWALDSLAVPVQTTSADAILAISGGAYALVDTTAQAAATNEVLWSNDASNAAWLKTACTVSPNVAFAPDGTVTADKLVESATNAVHYEYQSITRLTNVPLCFSRRFAAAGRSSVTIYMDGNAFVDGARATFNLTTGAVTSVLNTGACTGASATMTYLGNTWWECKLSCTPTVAATSTLKIVTYIDSISGYLGDGTSGVYVGDAQLETGTVATSRILTTSAAVTRASGLVAPQRVVLPYGPVANDWVRVIIGNGIDTNVIDGNGSTFEGSAQPLLLDQTSGAVDLQFINGTWKVL